MDTRANAAFRRRMLAVPCLSLLALAPSVPAQEAVQQSPPNLEQRLTRGQFRAAGLDRLTPAQLAELNRLLREAQERSGFLPGMQDGPIAARLVGKVDGWAPGTVFVLDNGQQWKVLKGEARLRRPLQAPPVRVVPGFAGRWFLEVHEDYPKARV